MKTIKTRCNYCNKEVDFCQVHVCEKKVTDKRVKWHNPCVRKNTLIGVFVNGHEI